MLTALKVTFLAIAISLPVLMFLFVRSKRKELVLMLVSLAPGTVPTTCRLFDP